MADRKKAKQAAIDFSVETSTPAAPKTPAAKPKKAPVATASEILPGLRKAQREAAVPVHPRAAADKASRKAEIAQGIDEARMPRQKLAEQEAARERAPRPTEEQRTAFAAKQEAQRLKDKEAYEKAPVSKDEAEALQKTRIKRAKYPAGSRRGGRR